MIPQRSTLLDGWDTLLRTIGEPSDESIGPVAKSVPATVLGGFLGAGKTTLLCRLLESTGLNVIALVNDLASVNVDARRVAACGAETIAFDNGCACCVLGSDLAESLAAIGNRPRPPDAVVIEASGAADPTGIAQSIAAQTRVALDGIVTVLNAHDWEQRLEHPGTGPLFSRQMEAAHLVVVSHTEELSPQSWRLLRERIAGHVPGRPILRFQELSGAAQALDDLLLGASQRGARPTPPPARHEIGAFETLVLDGLGPLRGPQLESALSVIPPDVFRVKGSVVLRERGEEVLWDLQCVGPRWRLEPAQQSATPLVLIGRTGQALQTFADAVRASAKAPRSSDRADSGNLRSRTGEALSPRVARSRSTP